MEGEEISAGLPPAALVEAPPHLDAFLHPGLCSASWLMSSAVSSSGAADGGSANGNPDSNPEDVDLSNALQDFVSFRYPLLIYPSTHPSLIQLPVTSISQGLDLDLSDQDKDKEGRKDPSGGLTLIQQLHRAWMNERGEFS